MTHELKTLPKYFQHILDGDKTFEVRKNDRNFKVGDNLLLKEYAFGGHDSTQSYTGREIRCAVTYILEGGKFGIQPGYCVMSIDYNCPLK